MKKVIIILVAVMAVMISGCNSQSSQQSQKTKKSGEEATPSDDGSKQQSQETAKSDNGGSGEEDTPSDGDSKQQAQETAKSDNGGSITYNKGPFTVINYHGKANIELIEITKIRKFYDNLDVSYRIIGTVYGGVWCCFDAKCYDADGFVIADKLIVESVSDGERFRVEGRINLVPSGTVRIKFE
jgi:hypothetical protein